MEYWVFDRDWGSFCCTKYCLCAYEIVYVILILIYSKKPLFGVEIDKENTPMKFNFIIGSMIFGFGWGLGGLTPVVVLILMPLESLKIVVYWGLACVIGMKISHKLF